MSGVCLICGEEKDNLVQEGCCEDCMNLIFIYEEEKYKQLQLLGEYSGKCK